MTTRSGYQALLSRRYELWGYDVSFQNPKTGDIDTLSLIDLTNSTMSGDNFTEVATVDPKAAARRSDLTALGLKPSDMIGSDISLNGVLWTIRSHSPKPGPHGPEDGEVFFSLVAACV